MGRPPHWLACAGHRVTNRKFNGIPVPVHLAGSNATCAKTKCRPPKARFAAKSSPFPGAVAKPGDASKFKVGADVNHPSFGKGKVIGVESNGEIVSVLFDDHGLKKIFADADGFKPIDK